MGRTCEQKARSEEVLRRFREERAARREAEEKARRERLTAPPEKVFTIEHMESVLVMRAFAVEEDGKAALPRFLQAEQELAAMKRARLVLERANIKTLSDVERHQQLAQPIPGKERRLARAMYWGDLEDELEQRLRPPRRRR